MTTNNQKIRIDLFAAMSRLSDLHAKVGTTPANKFQSLRDAADMVDEYDGLLGRKPDDPEYLNDNERAIVTSLRDNVSAFARNMNTPYNMNNITLPLSVLVASNAQFTDTIKKMEQEAAAKQREYANALAKAEQNGSAYRSAMLIFQQDRDEARSLVDVTAQMITMSAKIERLEKLVSNQPAQSAKYIPGGLNPMPLESESVPHTPTAVEILDKRLADINTMAHGGARHRALADISDELDSLLKYKAITQGEYNRLSTEIVRATNIKDSKGKSGK